LPNLDPELPEITKEEIQEFLEERAHDYVCPICRTQRFGTAEDMPYSRVPINGFGDQRNRMDRFIPLIWLVCQNCGYVAFFLASVFLKWKNDRG
jgi:hypothetical protein